MGAADVAEDLGFQFFGRSEFALVAEAVEKTNFNPGGRAAGPLFQQVSFDAERTFDEGGPVADVGDGAEKGS